MLLGNLGYHRSCSSTGTATHTTGNEYHIRALNRFWEISSHALFRCLLTNLRLCTRA